jgi:hypothetical protein
METRERPQIAGAFSLSIKEHTMKKSGKTRVKHTLVKKLTPAEMKKVTGGGCRDTECTSPTDTGVTCIAYVAVGP